MSGSPTTPDCPPGAMGQPGQVGAGFARQREGRALPYRRAHAVRPYLPRMTLAMV
jgi:hypothetical protein